MSNTTYIGKQIRSFESSPQFDGYSRVVIAVSEDVEYSAGVETGRTLTMECPWGTQAMADNILSSIRGFKYQPYTAADARLDPAAELGDGVTVNDIYGGIYTQETRFGPGCTASISAPAEEEIDHEFPYVPKQERKVTRQLYQLSAELKVQAGLISMEAAERQSDVERLDGLFSVQARQIEAKVNRTGGNASSFGWVLDDSSWTIKANGTDVLKATKNGLEVNGRITATSGKIGGFAIEPNSLSYNGQTWGGTNTTGIYIGPSGIQLGKNFKVDASGNLNAASGTFTGNVRAGSIQYGGSNGTLSGSALTAGSVYGGSGGAIRGGSITTFNTAGGINTSLGYANFAHDVFNDIETAGYMKAKRITAGEFLTTPAIYMSSRYLTLKTRQVMDGDGNAISITYIGA